MNGEEKDFWYALLDTLKNATASFILKHYPQLFELMSKHGLNSLEFEHGLAVGKDYVLIANVNVESYFKLTTQVILVRPLPGGSRRIEVGIVIRAKAEGFFKTLENSDLNLNESTTLFISVSDDTGKKEEYQFIMI